MEAPRRIRAILDRSTYRNLRYVLLDVTRLEAEQWAVANRPLGWRTESVSAIRGTANFTVNFREVLR